MANKKISEMTYKTLALDDQFPTINSASPTTNFYALAADIPLAVGVSQWNSLATYAAGHVVIYNGSTTKGLFMVNSTTSAGDAPDGTGYAKFKSLALAFIPTNIFTTTSTSGPNWTTAKERTGRCMFKNGTTYSGSSTTPALLSCDLYTGFDDTFLNAAKFNFTIAGPGLSQPMSIRNVVCLNMGTGVINVTVEMWGTGNIALNGRYIDFEIVG